MITNRNIFHQNFQFKNKLEHLKFSIETFSNPFQIGFISNVIQTISYQISIQTFSYRSPKSNTFQIYFSLVIKYQMVSSHVGLFKW